MKNSRYKTLCLLCSHYVITKAAEAHSRWMHRFTLPLTEECWWSSPRFCSVMSFIMTPVAPAHNWIPAARYKSAVITSVLMLLAQTGRRDHQRSSFSTAGVSWDSSKAVTTPEFESRISRSIPQQKNKSSRQHKIGYSVWARTSSSHRAGMLTSPLLFSLCLHVT